MADKLATSINRPLGLYRHLLRCMAVLPPDAQAHYKHRVRQVGRYFMVRERSLIVIYYIFMIDKIISSVFYSILDVIIIIFMFININFSCFLGGG